MEVKAYTKEDYATGELNLLKMEKETIIKAMSKTNGSMRESAKLLQITERTLQNKLPRHYLKREYFLKPR